MVQSNLSVLDKVRTAGQAGTIAAEKRDIPSYKTLAGIASDVFGARMVEKVTKTESNTLELGKMAAILDSKRDTATYKTLKKWVKHVTGIEMPSEVYKAALSFSMVTFNEPAKDSVFAGYIVEAEYDQTPVRWHYVVSSILNQLASKEHKGDAILAAEVREQVAAIMRGLPKNGGEKLKALLSALKPPESEAGSETEPLTVDELTEIAKRLKTRLDLTKDMPTLEHASNVFNALGAYSAGLNLAAPEQPATPAKKPKAADKPELIAA